MAVTYGFYNSLNKDRVYNAEQMSSIFNGIISDGVFSTIGDALTTVAGTGLQVVVKPGRAWFDSTWTLNDALLPLDIETADAALSRIDAIILEVNSGASVRANSIKVLKGSASANPVKPTLSDMRTLHQHALAYVTVPAGATSITASNIEINVGKAGCPFVTSVLQQVNITDLFNQWEAEFEDWFADVQSQLSGDVAANLLNKINQKVDLSAKAINADIDAGKNDSKWVTPANISHALLTAYDHLYSPGDIKASVMGQDPNVWEKCNGMPLNASSEPLSAFPSLKIGGMVEKQLLQTDLTGNSYCLINGKIISICGGTISGTNDPITAKIYDIESSEVKIKTIYNSQIVATVSSNTYFGNVFIVNNSMIIVPMYAESYFGSESNNDGIYLLYSHDYGVTWNIHFIRQLHASYGLKSLGLEYDDINSRFYVYAAVSNSYIDADVYTYYGSVTGEDAWAEVQNGVALWNSANKKYLKFITDDNDSSTTSLYAYFTDNIDDDGASAADRIVIDSVTGNSRYRAISVSSVKGSCSRNTNRRPFWQIEIHKKSTSSNTDISYALITYTGHRVATIPYNAFLSEYGYIYKEDGATKMVIDYASTEIASAKIISVWPSANYSSNANAISFVNSYDQNAYIGVANPLSSSPNIYLITAPEGETTKVFITPNIPSVDGADYYIKIAKENT